MRLHPKVREVLDEIGLPWSVEPGTKHDKLLVEGRVVTILPHGRTREVGRDLLNQRAQIRRAARVQ